MFGHDLDAACIGVQSVGEIQRCLHGDAFQQERIERHVVLAREIGIDLFKLLHIVGAEIALRPHPEQNRLDAAPLQPDQDLVQVALHLGGI